MAQQPQPNPAFEPEAEFVIDDLETLRVLTDPLRLRILELLGQARTVKQVASELDIPPTKLYYHVNQLEQHGLIRVVDTRIVSGIIEKHYRITARSYRVKNGLFSPGSPESDENLDLTLSTLFDNAKQEIKESVQAGTIDMSEDAPRSFAMNIAQSASRMTPEQAEDFFKRLEVLQQEFVELRNKPGNENAQIYKLLIIGYPTSRVRPDSDES